MLTTLDRYRLEQRGIRGCNSCLHWYCPETELPCRVCESRQPGPHTRWESCREAVELLDGTNEG